jgi:PhnB protein
MTQPKKRVVQLNPYLLFNGQCEAASKFREQGFGGKIDAMMAHGESPLSQQVSSERRDKIIQARMLVGDKVLMGPDAPPEHYEEPKGFSAGRADRLSMA